MSETNTFRVLKDGMKYTLASAKLVKGNGGRMSYMKSKEIEHLYVRSTCLQKMLESICSFQLMETTKVVARLGKNIGDEKFCYRCELNHANYNFAPHFHLGHFQSDARSIYYIDRVNIKGIQEVGHVGEFATSGYIFLCLALSMHSPFPSCKAVDFVRITFLRNGVSGDVMQYKYELLVRQ